MSRLASVTLVAALLQASPAAAYKIETAQGTGVELRWTELPMKFNIHQANPPGLTAAQWQGAIRAAYKTWSDVSCSYYSASDQGVVNLPTGNDSDHINTAVFRSSWPSSMGANALGVTQTKYDPYSGKILDADTHYNPNYTWSVTGSYYDIDAQGVATHEIGHQLGLDHSQYQDATMFYATGAGDTTQRSLHSDDIAGICYLYPSGSAPPPECSTSTDCSPSETCQNGKCVVASALGYGSPCNSNKECQSDLCISDGGSNTFCSKMCDTSTPCPNGDKCLPLQNGGSACLPGSASWGTQDQGQPCQSSLDCKTDLYCISVPGTGYLCASKCDVNQNNCPTGYYCAAATGGGGFCVPGTSPTNPPPTTPKSKLGEACTAGVDCESGVCALTSGGMVCVQWCDDSSPCPTGFKCVPAGTKKVCVADSGTTPPPPAPGELGADCTDHSDCKSGICGADATGKRFCTQLCDPNQGCATGFDCVPAGSDKYACTPSVTGTNPADGGGGGGCTVGRANAADARWLLLIFGAVLGLLLRRRR